MMRQDQITSDEGSITLPTVTKLNNGGIEFKLWATNMGYKHVNALLQVAGFRLKWLFIR